MQAQKNCIPLSRGPFRAIFISFHNETKIQEFKNLFFKLTLEHPNYIHFEGDKHKIIIYYKYTYDVAYILEAHGSNKNVHIRLHFDKLSRFLHPEILCIQCVNTRHLRIALVNLGGDIIHQTKKGTQVQFKNFKEAAIAHEELREQFSTKFAYKVEVPVLLSAKSAFQDNYERTTLSQDFRDQAATSIQLGELDNFNEDILTKTSEVSQNPNKKAFHLKKSNIELTSYIHMTQDLPDVTEKIKKPCQDHEQEKSQENNRKKDCVQNWINHVQDQFDDSKSESNSWETDYSQEYSVSDLRSIISKIKIKLKEN